MDPDGERDAGSKGRLRMTGGDPFAQRGGSGSIRRDLFCNNEKKLSEIMRSVGVCVCAPAQSVQAKEHDKDRAHATLLA